MSKKTMYDHVDMFENYDGTIEADLADFNQNGMIVNTNEDYDKLRNVMLRCTQMLNIGGARSSCRQLSTPNAMHLLYECASCTKKLLKVKKWPTSASNVTCRAPTCSQHDDNRFYCFKGEDETGLWCSQWPHCNEAPPDKKAKKETVPRASKKPAALSTYGFELHKTELPEDLMPNQTLPLLSHAVHKLLAGYDLENSQIKTVARKVITLASQESNAVQAQRVVSVEGDEADVDTVAIALPDSDGDMMGSPESRKLKAEKAAKKAGKLLKKKGVVSLDGTTISAMPMETVVPTSATVTM